MLLACGETKWPEAAASDGSSNILHGVEGAIPSANAGRCDRTVIRKDVSSIGWVSSPSLSTRLRRIVRRPREGRVGRVGGGD